MCKDEMMLRKKMLEYKVYSINLRLQILGRTSENFFHRLQNCNPFPFEFFKDSKPEMSKLLIFAISHFLVLIIFGTGKQ